jgi:EAL domain-containing protein (putative c-di-GMP-specific phosphodiesterase class I)/DNA-binding NarL/FixJ family response regulator
MTDGEMTAAKRDSAAKAWDRDDGPVLVVDDEPGVRRILCRLLAKMGLQVTEAASGIEAAAAVSAQDHGLIISDIAMPGMDGMALLREVRKHDHDVPVILVTGKPSFESAVSAIEYGAFHYFVKPFNNDEFRTVVTRALQCGRIARAKRRALSLMGSQNPPPGDLAGLAASFESAVEHAWMAFQPIVQSGGDHGAYGFEALLRSEEPTLPNPGAVLAAAERLDRLRELGRVLRGRAAEPYLERDDDVCLFVNLHPQDLMDPELDDPASPLCQIASRVVLEVTERASLENLEDVRSRVMDLRAVGFRIAVDDLGAGYSGLTSLATLQPEIVKIDMSLIRGVDRDTTRQRLIGSITRASQDMGILVVAEGIETGAERDAIVSLGCDLLQGFLFGRPGRAFPEHGW